MQILTPLTSSSKLVPFEVTQKHRDAFECIKRQLIDEPLFCNLIRENAVKYLWVDAASSSGCLGAVLAQRIYTAQSRQGLDPNRSISQSNPPATDIFEQLTRI